VLVVAFDSTASSIASCIHCAVEALACGIRRICGNLPGCDYLGKTTPKTRRVVSVFQPSHGGNALIVERPLRPGRATDKRTWHHINADAY
jgi:hypothetical protein